MKRDYQTLDDVQAEYFQERPEEIAPFIEEIFDDYAEDGNAAILLAHLRIIAQVKGISNLADEIGMTRAGLQKALSAKGNPRLDNINAIINALGYRLTVAKKDTAPRA